MPEFNFPLQAEELLEPRGESYMVQLPFEVATMAPEEIVDLLEGASPAYHWAVCQSCPV